MGLLAARNAGMEVPDEVVKAAIDYMNRSTGKDGSVAYSAASVGWGVDEPLCHRHAGVGGEQDEGRRQV